MKSFKAGYKKLNESTSVAPTSTSSGQIPLKLTDKVASFQTSGTDSLTEAEAPIVKAAYIKTMGLTHKGYGYYSNPKGELFTWIDSTNRFQKVDKDVIKNLEKSKKKIVENEESEEESDEDETDDEKEGESTASVSLFT